MEKRIAAESTEPEDRARKRRKQSATEASSKSELFLLDAQRLLELILRRKDRTRLIHKEFKTLPNRASYPDYYEEIKHPIALSDIQHKLSTNQYEKLQELKKDLVLMCGNAKEYNDPKSQIYKDACVLLKVVEEFVGSEAEKNLTALPGDAGRRQATARRNGSIVEEVAEHAGLSPKIEQAMLKIVEDLLNTVDESGETMFEDFRNLVNRKKYPEYYRIIKEPMSLNTIRKRVLAHKYPGWPEFARDLNLIVTNAESFNEEDSEIVMLARELRNRYEEKLMQARGRHSAPHHGSGSGIKLKLNVHHPQQLPMTQRLPVTATPKIKLTYNRTASGGESSPTSAQQVPKAMVKAPLQSGINGVRKPKSEEQQNGITPAVNGKIPQPLVSRVEHSTNGYSQGPPASRPHISAKVETLAENSHVPPTSSPMITDVTQVHIPEQSPAPATAKKSPSGTPKPTRNHTPRETSRTPIPTVEAESITVIPRAKQLSPSLSRQTPSRELPPRWKSVTPADHPAHTSMPIACGLSGTVSGDNRHVLSPTTSPTSQPMTVSSSTNGLDPRFRALGKGLEDALISCVTVATHPELRLGDTVEYRFPAHPTKAFQNHVVFFASEHIYLLVTLELGQCLRDRLYTPMITVNGHRLLFSNIQHDPAGGNDSFAGLTCDVRLNRGKVSHIEVSVVATQGGGKSGTGEQEKFTVDAFLQYD